MKNMAKYRLLYFLSVYANLANRNLILKWASDKITEFVSL